MNLRGVLFDFGYTLAYPDEESVTRYREKLVSILMKYGYNKTLDDFVLVLESTYRNATKGKMKDIYELWKSLLENLGIPERSTLVQEFTELRKHYVATRLRLYDDVILVLSTLKKKYKLALVSNCFVGLSDILRVLDLSRFFECTILSYEVGVIKPDKRIYLEALRRLRLRPGECVFVSDAISDLEGAREVGLGTILICQGEYTICNVKDSDFKPDFQSKHISQIMEYL